jgi:hypothetical protein
LVHISCVISCVLNSENRIEAEASLLSFISVYLLSR